MDEYEKILGINEVDIRKIIESVLPFEDICKNLSDLFGLPLNHTCDDVRLTQGTVPCVSLK